jgi:Uma2 family endonuclease
MSAVHPGYTIEDLERQREGSDLRYELIDGALAVTPTPEPSHNLLAGELFAQLRAWLRANGSGRVLFSPVDVQLDPRTVVEPDLIVLLGDRLSLIGPKRITGAPSMVVEIISPSSRRLDAVEKRAAYARAGVPEYWLVDPELGVVVRHSEPSGPDYSDARVFNRDERLLAATIAGLLIDLGAVFAELEPGSEGARR